MERKVASNVVYRYSEILYSPGVDENERSLGPPIVRLHLAEYPIVGETAQALWIDVYGERRLMYPSARRKFAARTKEEALESFKARKRRQIKILGSQLDNAKRALALAEGESRFVP